MAKKAAATKKGGHSVVAAVTKAADIIQNAYDTGVPIPPIRTRLPDGDIDAAYAVQELNTKLRLKRGARLTGRKIGLTSKSIQKRSASTGPTSASSSTPWPLPTAKSCRSAQCLQPRVEGEIAFVMDKDMKLERPTTTDVIKARLCLSRDRDLRLAHRQMGLRDAVLAHPTMAEGLGPLLSNVAPRVE